MRRNTESLNGRREEGEMAERMAEQIFESREEGEEELFGVPRIMVCLLYTSDAADE